MFNQYILIIVWMGLVAILANNSYRQEYDRLSGEYKWRVSFWFGFVAIFPIIWMATNRGYFVDTTNYIASYHFMPGSFSEIPAYYASVKKDKGFYLMSAVIRVLMGYDHEPYLFIIALFQGISLVCLFKKYSSDFAFSIFLFVASTDYISWMFNGIRQFTAVAIALFATSFMLEKKYIKALLIVLLASTMHQSALLVIPFMIIAQGEAWNKKTVLFILVAVVATVFVQEFTGMLNDALQSTQYGNVVSDYTEWNDDGTNPIRVLVYSVPAFLSFYGRRTIRESGDVVINFCANMSIITAGLYLVSMVTSGIFIGRLPIYASLYSYILLPWVADHIFNGKNLKILIVFGYLMFYFVQLHFVNGLI